MKLIQKLTRFVMVTAIAAGITAPAKAQSTTQTLSSESVIESIKREGVLRVGLSLFKPWSMRDKNGNLVGFELDVARKLADDMSVEIEFQPTSWDGIIPALVSGKFDVIISGMSITPARNLTVNFSDPYALSGMVILANKSKTEGFSEADYNSADVTFTARRGGTASTVIKTVFPEAQLLLFDEDGAANQEMLNGNAHATLAYEPEPTLEINKYPNVLHKPFDNEYLPSGEAFALRKGDPDALNYFNNWIATQYRNGFLKDRQDYWFRSLEWQSQAAE